jgi:hypothetical protein
VVLGYTVLGHAPTILTLSLFIAIVGTLSRMYRDSEMVIWFSSRARGWAFRLAAGALCLAGAADDRGTGAVRLALGAPAIAEAARPVREPQRHGAGGAGQFQESAGGNRVFFIDKDSVGGKTAGEVFIAANERGVQTVTSARAGRDRDHQRRPVPAVVQRPATGEPPGRPVLDQDQRVRRIRRADQRKGARDRAGHAAPGAVHPGAAGRAHAGLPGGTVLAHRAGAGGGELRADRAGGVVGPTRGSGATATCSSRCSPSSSTTTWSTSAPAGSPPAPTTSGAS